MKQIFRKNQNLSKYLNALKSLSIHLSIFISICLMFAGESYAGYKTGNGGDHVRGTFIKMGQAVIDFLNNDDIGQALLKKNSLDIASLQSTLDINVLEVAEGGLIDNGGVPVDGIGQVGKITLNKENWMNHFENDRDIYYLVLHEMLRAIGVNDDNYVISAAINPFPASRKIITRISTKYPLIDGENLQGLVDINSLIVTGSGCSKDKAGTNVEFDSTKNQIEISLSNSQVNISQPNTIERKSCMLSLPLRLAKNQRLVVTQIDQSAKLELGKNIVGVISNEVFMSGSKAPVVSKQVVTQDLPLVGRTLLRRNEVLRSACGSKDLLRVNSSGLVQSKGGAIAALSVDRITISLKLEACK